MGRGLVPTLELTRDRSLDDVRLVANDISAVAFADELWEMPFELVDDVCRLLLRLPFACRKRHNFQVTVCKFQTNLELCKQMASESVKKKKRKFVY